MNLKVPGAILPLGCAILSTRANTVRGLVQPSLGELGLKDKLRNYFQVPVLLLCSLYFLTNRKKKNKTKQKTKTKTKTKQNKTNKQKNSSGVLRNMCVSVLRYWMSWIYWQLETLTTLGKCDPWSTKFLF